MYKQDKDKNNILEKINSIKNDIKITEEKIKIKNREQLDATMTKKYDLSRTLGSELFNLIYQKQNLEKTLDQLNKDLQNLH